MKLARWAAVAGILALAATLPSSAKDWPSAAGTTAKGIVIEDGAGNNVSNFSSVVVTTEATLRATLATNNCAMVPSGTTILIATVVKMTTGQCLLGPGMVKSANGFTDPALIAVQGDNVTISQRLVLDGNVSNNFPTVTRCILFGGGLAGASSFTGGNYDVKCQHSYFTGFDFQDLSSLVFNRWTARFECTDVGWDCINLTGVTAARADVIACGTGFGGITIGARVHDFIYSLNIDESTSTCPVTKVYGINGETGTFNGIQTGYCVGTAPDNDQVHGLFIVARNGDQMAQDCFANLSTAGTNYTGVGTLDYVDIVGWGGTGVDLLSNFAFGGGVISNTALEPINVQQVGGGTMQNISVGPTTVRDPNVGAATCAIATGGSGYSSDNKDWAIFQNGLGVQIHQTAGVADSCSFGALPTATGMSTNARQGSFNALTTLTGISPIQKGCSTGIANCGGTGATFTFTFTSGTRCLHLQKATGASTTTIKNLAINGLNCADDRGTPIATQAVVIDTTNQTYTNVNINLIANNLATTFFPTAAPSGVIYQDFSTGFKTSGPMSMQGAVLGAPTLQVRMNSNQSFSSGIAAAVLFDTSVIDSNSNYSAGAGTYTPQIAGTYHIATTICAQASGWTAGNNFQIFIQKNAGAVNIGLPVMRVEAVTGIYCLSGQGNINLNGSSDTLRVAAQMTGTTPVVTGSTQSFMSIHRIGP